MLLLLSWELTLVGRDMFGRSTYENSAMLESNVVAIRERSYSDAEKIEIARGLTDMHHQISGHLLKMGNPEGRYPDDVLISVLCNISEAHGMNAGLPHWWQRAYSRLRSGWD